MKLQCYRSLHGLNQQFVTEDPLVLGHPRIGHAPAQCMHPEISTVLRLTEDQHRMQHLCYKCSMPCCFVPQDFCAFCPTGHSITVNTDSCHLLSSAATDTRGSRSPTRRPTRAARILRTSQLKLGAEPKHTPRSLPLPAHRREAILPTPALVTEYRICNMIVSMHTEWIYCSDANRGLFCITCQTVSTAPGQAYQKGIRWKPPVAPCLCRRRGFKSQAKDQHPRLSIEMNVLSLPAVVVRYDLIH